MADETRRMEGLLWELGQDLQWPETPELAPAVRRRIERRRSRRLPLLLLAAALAGALALGTAVTAYIGLHGATISRVQSLPPASPRPSTSASPGDAAARLDLGRRYTSLGEAGSAAGFQPLVPASLGHPDEIYYQPEGRVVTLLYRPRPRLPATSEPGVGALVMETKAVIERNSFGKLVEPGTTIEPVTVNGGAGFWVSGAPHGFFFYSGGPSDHFRLAGDVLIWDQGELVIRVESSLGRAGALAMAGTVR